MKGYSCGVQDSFHPVNRPATTHEYKSYHMDLKDRLTPAFCLICEVVHKGRQANASAAEKLNNWCNHEGQYLWRTFKTEEQHLPFIQFPLPFKSKEFLDTGILTKNLNITRCIIRQTHPPIFLIREQNNKGQKFGQKFVSLHIPTMTMSMCFFLNLRTWKCKLIS